LVDQRLQQLALRGEPEAVVDHLGVAGDQRVAQMEYLAVQRDRLEGAPRDVQDGAAGRLVDASRLHADEPVLDEIDTPDAVLAAQAVWPRQQGHRPQAT